MERSTDMKPGELIDMLRQDWRVVSDSEYREYGLHLQHSVVEQAFIYLDSAKSHILYGDGKSLAIYEEWNNAGLADQIYRQLSIRLDEPATGRVDVGWLQEIAKADWSPLMGVSINLSTPLGRPMPPSTDAIYTLYDQQMIVLDIPQQGSNDVLRFWIFGPGSEQITISVRQTI